MNKNIYLVDGDTLTLDLSKLKGGNPALIAEDVPVFVDAPKLECLTPSVYQGLMKPYSLGLWGLIKFWYRKRFNHYPII